MADIEGLEYATCGACRGTGKIGDDDCSRCKGTGRVALPLVVKKRRVRKASSVSLSHLPRGESDSVSRSCLNLGCGVIGSAVTLTIVLLVVLGPL
jgi:RecJ-like exonuclease